MANGKLAPVAFFAFNRPIHTKAALDALLENAEAADTDLFVFLDGARNKADEALVNEVAEVVFGVNGFRSISVRQSPKNLGLATSITGGISQVLSEHDRIVVVEDDIVVSSSFLRFMNDGLSEYQDDAQVASIHGYSYPVEGPLPKVFFLRGADCWGWGTWARAWKFFNPSGQDLLSQLRTTNQLRDFDLGGVAPYSKLLRGQIKGTNDSWAVRWHASAYIANMFTLYPGKSLVRNIGIDGSGTHCGSSDVFSSPITQHEVDVLRIPIEESEEARQAFAGHFLKTSRSAGWRRAVRSLARYTLRG